MKVLTTLIFTITTTILGHAIWIVPLVNFVWLLVKDVTLFSWIWCLNVVIMFFVSLILMFISAAYLSS